MSRYDRKNVDFVVMSPGGCSHGIGQYLSGPLHLSCRSATDLCAASLAKTCGHTSSKEGRRPSVALFLGKSSAGAIGRQSPHCPRLSVVLRSRWRAVANGPAHISWPARVLASFISFHYSRFLYLVEDFLYNKSEMPAQISADVVTTSRLARATRSDVI